ncbi:hypothetical protein M378DRAFT_164459 [Amanita muscaria Koide BX008]|uniref:Uncharacterized protein n=1 Tax=Amanita muscaria (strain Koide BX008) TaxID=946122 RepID=A0A0C2T9P2_AMAMK|nr:hypothetical protein M378DRAFT_164459 [Amanita muscaria Koide BX008]
MTHQIRIFDIHKGISSPRLQAAAQFTLTCFRLGLVKAGGACTGPPGGTVTTCVRTDHEKVLSHEHYLDLGEEGKHRPCQGEETKWRGSWYIIHRSRCGEVVDRQRKEGHRSLVTVWDMQGICGVPDSETLPC